jgi:NADPH:quinone reductase-like Zn-dependent oxidoreductase
LKLNSTHTDAYYRRLGAKNAKVLRPTLFNYIATREEFEQYTNELFDFIVKDKMDVRIHKVYDLENVAPAHEVSRRRRAGGVWITIMAVLTRTRTSKVAKLLASCC